MMLSEKWPHLLSHVRTLGAAICCALLLAVCGAQSAQAKERATRTARAEAIIVTRLSLLKVDDLDFGRIVAGNTAGTVVMAPSGARTKTGGVTLASGANQPARFSGYGYPNQNVSIWIGANSVQLTRVGGTQKMTLDTFIIGSTPQTQLTTAPLGFRIGSSTGMFAFPLGATLRVGARQMPGVYKGSFTVLIQYN